MRGSAVRGLCVMLNVLETLKAEARDLSKPKFDEVRMNNAQRFGIRYLESTPRPRAALPLTALISK